jgi:hypothetical protein
MKKTFTVGVAAVLAALATFAVLRPRHLPPKSAKATPTCRKISIVRAGFLHTPYQMSGRNFMQ